MRHAIIPVVLITERKEEPQLLAFDEGKTEEEICAELSEDYRYLEDQPIFKTIQEFNDNNDQLQFQLLQLEMKVKS